MEQNAKAVSSRTKAISRAIAAFFMIGLALVVALLLCFVADIFGLWRSVIGEAFPNIVVLIVYVGAITVLLRLALAWSMRIDRR